MKVGEVECTKEEGDPAFEIKDRGFTGRAFYLLEPKGEALIEIERNGVILRRFLFPAYKIWNIEAHFGDIVDGELRNSTSGYEAAASTGI